MGILWEVEGQDEWFAARVFDFYSAAVQSGLSDEADFGIEFAELHVLVVIHFQLSNAAGSAVCVEQRRAFGAEGRLAAGLHGESQD